ncbi:MAG: nitrilase-related carbon-nitrogen hydrolase, partial [Candidatus Binatia bacterium]
SRPQTARMSSNGKFTAAAAQLSPRLGDVAANLELHGKSIAEARGRGADLVVFPELSLTGYLLRDMVPTVALRLESPELKQLRKLSQKIAIVVGLVEETRSFRFHNSAVFLDRGELVAVHRKVYLPTYGMFDEQRYFAQGSEIRAFDCRFGRGAMLICEDLWHPSTAYLAALDDALWIVCPSASPLRGISDGQEQDDNARYWELINRFYAATFSLSLVYANRVGFEDGIGFWGGSEILDAGGERIAKARYYEPDLVVAEIQPKVARRSRVAAPLLRDEDLDLTINELIRIRGRLTKLEGRTEKVSPAPDATRRPLPKGERRRPFPRPVRGSRR